MPRSHFDFASAERGSFGRTIILSVDAGTNAVRGELLPANFMAWIRWIHAVCGKLVSAHCMTAASRLRGPLGVASCCQPTSWLKNWFLQ